MKGLSKLELQVIADLEFRKKYYFTREHIATHFANKRQMTDTLYRLHKKGRIVPLNKNKYCLVPIKARTGKWTENSFVLGDELFDGRDYFIGGWAAVHYWKLTNQMPMQIDIYTTRRQGKKNILTTRFVFHRTTQKKISKAIEQRIDEHPFLVLSKKDAERWMKSKR